MTKKDLKSRIYEIKLKQYRNRILFNYKDLLTLQKAYRYIRIIESKLKDNNYLTEEKVREYACEIERLYCDDYLIPYKPRFSIGFSKDDINIHSASSILDFIVNEVRREMYLEHFFYSKAERNISDVPTVNKCYDSSLLAFQICNRLKIYSEIYKINPGYTTKYNLYNGSGYHYVLYVELFGKKYLIDTTYSQFFITKRNVLDRLGICNIQNCLPGRFMIMTNERLAVANKILSDGWIEITKDNLKNYLDGFTLSYRNGLYYEKTNDFSYLTPYTFDNYLAFLEGKDDQVNYEGIECLGYQHKPLQNPYIDFKRRL